MNATGLNIDLRECAEIKQQGIDLRNRETTGTLSMQTPDEGMSDLVRAQVFKGEPLEASFRSQPRWTAVTDYFALSVIVVESEASPKLIVERLLNGEIVRIGELYIRKTPEARRELSQSRL
jgi:hypothetical protein